MFWLKASLPTVIPRGAIGAPSPACPQPARAAVVASASTTAAHRDSRSVSLCGCRRGASLCGCRRGASLIPPWPEVTLASLLPTVDIRTLIGSVGRHHVLNGRGRMGDDGGHVRVRIRIAGEGGCRT